MNEELYTLLQLKQLKLSQLKWVCHVVRVDPTEPVKCLFQQN